MVPPDKLKNALNALQAVLIHARMMAYENAEHKTIAAILDDAEYLPFLIGSKDDKTLELRDYLKEMAEKYHDARFIEVRKCATRRMVNVSIGDVRESAGTELCGCNDEQGLGSKYPPIAGWQGGYAFVILTRERKPWLEVRLRDDGRLN